MKTANKVMDYLSIDDIAEADDSSSSLYQSAMHACFNLGFEVREGGREGGWRGERSGVEGGEEGGEV